MDEEIETPADEVAPEPAAEETPAEESIAEAAAPDLETRIADLEAAVIALGGPDRIPTL